MYKISEISQDDGERLLFASSQNGPGAATRWELILGFYVSPVSVAFYAQMLMDILGTIFRLLVCFGTC